MTVSRASYARRRRTVLQKYTDQDLIILVASPEATRNADSKYIYRQDSYLHYLTGFDEPRSVMVLAPGRLEGEYVLFNLPNDPKQEMWTGKRAGQRGAVESFDADQAFSIDELAQQLPLLMKDRSQIHVQSYIGERSLEEKTVIKLISDSQCRRCDILPLLTSMRLIKDDEELALMREAVRITREGHISAMEHCVPGMFEYEVEAYLMKKFYQHGSRAQAYPNIVASGPNACTLHYETNTRKIENGDLLLLDAAAEYQTYAADITRTFPANGKFTEEQRAIYEIVLRAQAAGINAVAPGVTFKQISDAIQREMTMGLLAIGLLQGDLETLIKNVACAKFFPHSFGHWIGLDVHDVGIKNKDGERVFPELASGMVITVEPGIYIPETLADIDKKWHRIGVRIEDVVLVTTQGYEVLSAAIPKAIAEIETLMAKAAHRRDAKFKLFNTVQQDKSEAAVTSTCCLQ